MGRRLGLKFAACSLLMFFACIAPPSLDGGLRGSDGGLIIPTTLTWYKDVLPIAQASCNHCHVVGGIAPFALDTYSAARPRASQMSAAVASGSMPPWMPSDTCGGPFVGDRRLSPGEIDIIVQWAAGGAPEGNVSDSPPATDGGLSGLARVDQTLTMKEPYTPSHVVHDDYRCFLIDPQGSTTKNVVAYDIKPGVQAQVHHVIVYIVDLAEAKAKDATEAGSGWTCYGAPGIPTSGALGAWAPGMPAVTFPVDTGIPLPAGKGLAMQVHYNVSNGNPVPDQTSMQLQYATTPVKNAYLIDMPNSGFSIPPMTSNYTHSKTFQNPYGVPLKIYGYLPHMHKLGKSITIYGAGAKCLIEIPQWDFHWQQQYFTVAPYVLPTAQSLTLSCSWNNPTASTVTWGEGTADEMCFAFLYASP